MDKVWITKYALTSGIIEKEAEIKGGIAIVSTLETYYGKEWHRTEEDAKKRAEEMRLKKIESLKKQIERLEKIQF